MQMHYLDYSIQKEALFNETTKATCQSVLSSVEEAPAVERILVAQYYTVGSDDVTSDIGTNFSQIDLFVEQTVDVTINWVKQLLSAAHKPSKRQMALQSSECQRYLREWNRPFLKDGSLYRRYTQ